MYYCPECTMPKSFVMICYDYYKLLVENAPFSHVQTNKPGSPSKNCTISENQTAISAGVCQSYYGL